MILLTDHYGTDLGKTYVESCFKQKLERRNNWKPTACRRKSSGVAGVKCEFDLSSQILHTMSLIYEE